MQDLIGQKAVSIQGSTMGLSMSREGLPLLLAKVETGIEGGRV